MPFAAGLALRGRRKPSTTRCTRVDLAGSPPRKPFTEARRGPRLSLTGTATWQDACRLPHRTRHDGWPPTPMVVLERADAFPRRRPDRLRHRLSIFRDAADTWREDGVPF